MPVIYLDVLVVLNTIIDYLLLSLTARLTTQHTRRFRPILAAVGGGIASCQILWEIPTVVSVLLHIVTAAGMAFIAFPLHSWKQTVRCVVVLFCLSALLSGVVSALWYLTNSDAFITHNGVIYCDISPLMLVAFALVGYGTIALYDRITRHRAPQGLSYTLTLEDEGGVCECRALYDTGLHLREPFSGMPVIVVWRRAVTSILPPSFAEIQNGCGGVATAVSPRLRMIPYHAVGGTGLLPSFVPRRVILQVAGQPPRDITGVYVALLDEAERGDYTALIGGDVVAL